MFFSYVLSCFLLWGSNDEGKRRRQVVTEADDGMSLP